MSNVKDEKDGTKNVPPPTSEGDEGRVTAETVVTDGTSGMERLAELTRKIIRRPDP